MHKKKRVKNISSDLCPKCRNIGWVPTKFENVPVVMYGSEIIATHKGNIVFRYKRCLNCGFRWISKEEFYREVEKKVKEISDAGKS